LEKCLFVVRKESTKKQQTHEVKPNLGKTCAIDFCMLKNLSSCHYQTDHNNEWVEICCGGELAIVESFNLRNEELVRQSSSCIARSNSL